MAGEEILDIREYERGFSQPKRPMFHEYFAYETYPSIAEHVPNYRVGLNCDLEEPALIVDKISEGENEGRRLTMHFQTDQDGKIIGLSLRGLELILDRDESGVIHSFFYLPDAAEGSIAHLQRISFSRREKTERSMTSEAGEIPWDSYESVVLLRSRQIPSQVNWEKTAKMYLTGRDATVDRLVPLTAERIHAQPLVAA